MPIQFNEKSKIFKLDTSTTSYVIKIFDENYLLNLYYGNKIPDTDFGFIDRRYPNASFSPANPVIGEHGFSPDCAPMEYGTNGAGDFRISALAIRNSNGDNVTDIRYVSHKIYKGKKAIPSMPSTYTNSNDEAVTLEILTTDKVTGANVTLIYTVFENQPVMTKRVEVKNNSDKTLYIEKIFSLCANFTTDNYDMITLYGRHARERYEERRPLAHGVQGVESKRGVSGHAQNPFTALVARNADENQGDAYGFNLVYSGNFSSLAEVDYSSAVRYILGINPDSFEWTLNSGETFYAPEAVSVYTDKGIGEMSRIFHRFYNNNLIRGKYKTSKRPLLINSWEAAYFDFDTDKLVAFAKTAKELGIEMLVMDDGWFGKRNDDTNSLGDWFVNTNKLKGGLKPLIDGVNEAGLKFGIWYEPEMISPDSDLFRAHPDWHVHVDNREPMLGRHQYVLDVSREDVRENIWTQLYSVLSQNKIDYVKWDFNRNIADAGSALLPPERKKEFFHRFILGTYDLMNRLVTTFPDILFEGCSGGGGRFDPAMLCYSPQIWTSDNTDPIERLYIQFGTSMCYPASCQSSHVSSCDRTDYKTKGDVAMWGTFGYELDPLKLTEEDRETVKQQIKDYHKYYDLIRKGDLYRLVSPFENEHYAIWEIVSENKKSALLTKVCIREQFCGLNFVKLKGLDENAYYKNNNTDEVFSGAYLMNVGLNLSDYADKTGKSYTVYFTQV